MSQRCEMCDMPHDGTGWQACLEYAIWHYLHARQPDDRLIQR